MPQFAMNCRAALIFAGLLGSGALLDGAMVSALAQAARLDGTWNGAGRMVLSSGNAERVRCRATFRRQASRTFGMSAICATPSARVSQVARVQQVSAGRFEGRFYNREYDVSGTIRVTVRGNRLTASLSGGGASALLSLAR